MVESAIDFLWWLIKEYPISFSGLIAAVGLTGYERVCELRGVKGR